MRDYHTTTLEDWVTNFYKRLHIMHPKQIKEDEIAQKLYIFIHRKPLPSSFQVIGRYQGITVDSRASIQEQKEMFFHELCHILRHAGRQGRMPAAFRDLQEWDARNFVRYAAIPHHHLRYINFDQVNLSEHIADLFDVSVQLAGERIHQIETRARLLAK